MQESSQQAFNRISEGTDDAEVRHYCLRAFQRQEHARAKKKPHQCLAQNHNAHIHLVHYAPKHEAKSASLHGNYQQSPRPSQEVFKRFVFKTNEEKADGRCQERIQYDDRKAAQPSREEIST